MLKKLKLGLIALVIATTLLGAGVRFLPQTPVVFACEPAGHGGGC